MKPTFAGALALAIATALSAPAVAQNAKEPQMSSPAYNGPFAAPSPLDLNYPQFDKIRDSDFAPAFEAGMAQELREIDAIADNPEKPTFQNTIVAMEKSGQLLGRARSVFGNLVGTDKTEARDKLQTEYAPKFSAHNDAIALNPKLFARIKALYDQRDVLDLDAIDRRLLEKRYEDFVRA
ncbi:MAG TPA: dipeptidyl carboxypeptidase II, partial [Pseudoxanthomonas sp.]|nr:dipeptidyl carboxypeptidase II [Pseudoxanthomonas sp.]